jgi:hypothetical protein
MSLARPTLRNGHDFAAASSNARLASSTIGTSSGSGLRVREGLLEDLPPQPLPTAAFLAALCGSLARQVAEVQGACYLSFGGLVSAIQRLVRSC